MEGKVEEAERHPEHNEEALLKDVDAVEAVEDVVDVEINVEDAEEYVIKPGEAARGWQNGASDQHDVGPWMM